MARQKLISAHVRCGGTRVKQWCGGGSRGGHRGGIGVDKVEQVSGVVGLRLAAGFVSLNEMVEGVGLERENCTMTICEGVKVPLVVPCMSMPFGLRQACMLILGPWASVRGALSLPVVGKDGSSVSMGSRLDDALAAAAEALEGTPWLSGVCSDRAPITTLAGAMSVGWQLVCVSNRNGRMALAVG